jgi:hypothetical protein
LFLRKILFADKTTDMACNHHLSSPERVPKATELVLHR